ncbi:MAG: hypothetical protein QXO57_04025 [Candidatus Aenigmatarchaeota archaeon]
MRIKVSLLIFVSCFAALGCKTESPTLPPPQPDPCKKFNKPNVQVIAPKPGTIYNPEIMLEVVFSCSGSFCEKKFQIVNNEGKVVEEWSWERGRIANEEISEMYTRAFIRPTTENWKIRLFAKGDKDLRCPFDFEIPYKIGIPPLRDYIKKAPARDLAILPQGEVHNLDLILKFMNDYFTEGVVRFILNGSGFPIYIYPVTSDHSPCPDVSGCAASFRDRCEIHLNIDKGGFFKATIVHELGHCFLVSGHSPDEMSFMCSSEICQASLLNFPPEERWSMKVLNSQN